MVSEIFGDSLHVKRVESLANGAHGVLQAARLSIHAIGAAYAGTAEIQPKHGIKQVDRYLSNDGFDLATLLSAWSSFVLGERSEALVALDWTDFDDDDHSTLAAYLLTSHGRATPLAWMTVNKSKLKSRMSKHERTLLRRLHEAIPETVRVTIVADRGFGKLELFEYITKRLSWDYIIRIRGNFLVTTKDGRAMPANDRVPKSGRAGKLVDVKLTNRAVALPALVLKRKPGAKAPWCIATSRADDGAAAILKWYAKRFSIEETFRDQKDLRFGARPARHAHREPCAPRPSPASGRHCSGAAHPARRRRRGSWARSLSSREHRQAQDPLAVPSGLLLVRRSSHHAR